MAQRGWTWAMVEEAIKAGDPHAVVNLETSTPATRYIHPITKRSVVVDDASGEVIHVGGDGFLY